MNRIKKKKEFKHIAYDFNEQVIHIENDLAEEVTPINEIVVTGEDQYGNYKDVVWEVILN